ncbi:hypothetical protein OOU_Y34scaffold00140g108 [Pyricularia oryzae Y34]|uniref:Uncharacterized protein n=2 Tax=Pyricularia oryzae TaxID=318829 RepID=A0AA97PQZ3_PYRO3|nr:hypothetical protein OOU_Y34scaffold00140g108 [Pyricularia oryzae Y34]
MLLPHHVLGGAVQKRNAGRRSKLENRGISRVVLSNPAIILIEIDGSTTGFLGIISMAAFEAFLCSP